MRDRPTNGCHRALSCGLGTIGPRPSRGGPWCCSQWSTSTSRCSRRPCSTPTPAIWSRGRFSADQETLERWAERWCGEVVAVEATTGWRWVRREPRLAASMSASPSRCRRGRCSAAAQREDRPDGRALAGAAAGEGDAARVVDPARGDSAPARPHLVAEGDRRGPPPLGPSARQSRSPRPDSAPRHGKGLRMLGALVLACADARKANSVLTADARWDAWSRRVELVGT